MVQWLVTRHITVTSARRVVVRRHLARSPLVEVIAQAYAHVLSNQFVKFSYAAGALATEYLGNTTPTPSHKGELDPAANPMQAVSLPGVFADRSLPQDGRGPDGVSPEPGDHRRARVASWRGGLKQC